MRIIRPEVVGHFDAKGDRYAIYSCDIQPHANRLATAGSDCRVMLWNVDCLLDPQRPSEAQLAVLGGHKNPVNVVRWSRDGRLLASGSDDSFIRVHRHTPLAISSFGGSQRERWSLSCTLRGHSMDVLDLDWAPDGLLASASVDNRILLWRLPDDEGLREVGPIRVLQGHGSFVKGLSFDPVGRYLVSAGRDNLILVWDAQQDFKIIKTMDKPLKDSPDTTIFRRISWSPDGQSVCVASAYKSRRPIGKVLKRGTWDAEEDGVDLVGHSACSISTRFSQSVMSFIMPEARRVEPKKREVGAGGAEKDDSMDVEGGGDRDGGGSGKGGRGDGGDREDSLLNLTTTSTSAPTTTSTSSSSSAPFSPALGTGTEVEEREGTGTQGEEEEEGEGTEAGTEVGAGTGAEMGGRRRVGCAVALGDQQGVLSIWGTHDTRPLYVLRDVCAGAITDIAWKPVLFPLSEGPGVGTGGGKQREREQRRREAVYLVCCGIDGVVTIVDLENELGTPLSEAALDRHLQQFYGQRGAVG
ncbi:WD40-repeat-containing domain protein, partial [Ochromonadaceae sp. CCMP2298]